MLSQSVRGYDGFLYNLRYLWAVEMLMLVCRQE